MRGYETQRYDRPVEESDDYEYDGDGYGYGYEDEGDEYEEEEEEEAPKPTKEALEYLELRQPLKERLRRDLKKEGASRANSNGRQRLPYDNFGSFFGPSQPVIAERVIQESKSLWETQHLASRVKNPVHPNKKSSGSTSSGSKPVAHNQKPRVINEEQNKLQKLKNTRDYSFLLSEDAELPAPAKDRPPRSDFCPKSEVRSSQTVATSKQHWPNNGRPAHDSRDNGGPVHGSCDNGRTVYGSHDIGRPVHGNRDNGRPVHGSRDNGRAVEGSRDNRRHVQSGRDERKVAPTNGNIYSKVGSNRPSSASSRPGSTSMDSRKRLGSNNANGPGRPLGPKALPSKMPTSERRASAPGLQRTPSLKPQPSVLKQPVPQRKEVQETYKLNMLSKPSTGLLSKQQAPMHRQMPSRPMPQEYRPKKRPASRFADDEYDPESGGNISSLIRGMFGYNPNKYNETDDDSDMEAGFDDIQREERRSAKIGRKEDEEQAKLIEEEERRERLAAKMRKQKKPKR